MKTVYLFDVDGTLTPVRQPMQPEFAGFFVEFVDRFPVFLISGSDYPKLVEQVPGSIRMGCRGIFASSGAQYFEADKPVFVRDHSFSDRILTMCRNFVEGSSYPLRTGTHIERRPGMLNVSVVGRAASTAERQDYHEWDGRTQERRTFMEHFNRAEPQYEASLGGQISVDIVPRGSNKSVAKREVLKRFPGASLMFFGDRIEEGGNDKPLADVLSQKDEPHRAVSVETWLDTWRHLKDYVDAKPLSRR